ncbi:hypothetical protein A2917_01140 [Candidatus Nomurabacteria bacterium RIFCSPLOWO2_01_FULL_42_17]|uniref:Uncharacterized protein n=1 Tax=Candidatus Nomurabacteria bacterium RIFCSPLOWO2_01_FULL_42_17 TaxID=1801780 RepID=A0A1F6XNZ8_9BACT|nr:MAG: hypothetical protein A2917_01140 [Candidatus Nomurabacteria bacterium RIFCSPLOWO2_01_FULL_42_17]
MYQQTVKQEEPLGGRFFFLWFAQKNGSCANLPRHGGVFFDNFVVDQNFSLVYKVMEQVQKL